MAWIEVFDDERTAPPAVALLYSEMVDPAYGRVDNILKIHSLHPAGMKAHYDLYRAVMKGTPTLRRIEREMIALVVSLINNCHY